MSCVLRVSVSATSPPNRNKLKYTGTCKVLTLTGVPRWKYNGACGRYVEMVERLVRIWLQCTVWVPFLGNDTLAGAHFPVRSTWHVVMAGIPDFGDHLIFTSRPCRRYVYLRPVLMAQFLVGSEPQVRVRHPKGGLQASGTLPVHAPACLSTGKFSATMCTFSCNRQHFFFIVI